MTLPSPEKFFETLDQLMAERKVTQKQLSEALGIGKNTYSYWRKKSIWPRQYVINGIADYFGVTTDYLLGQADSTPAISEETKVMLAYSKASEEVKHAIRILLKLE